MQIPTIPLLRFRSQTPPLRNWFVLAFLAGAVNAGGFLACERFVSHVTGFATLFGVDIAYRQWWDAVRILTIPGFFLCGAMISALLVERRSHQGKVPHYAYAMGLVFICLFLAGLGGHLGWFGKFGEPLSIGSDYVFLALLCLACGIQNAVISSISGSVVRTTHLTGLTTDLGIGLVRVLFPHRDEKKLEKERKYNKLRAGTIISFILGSTAGATLFAHYKYLGFLLPSGLAFYSMIAARVSWEKLPVAPPASPAVSS